MDYCPACRRHLNGALACPGCGAYAEAYAYPAAENAAVDYDRADGEMSHEPYIGETEAMGEAIGEAIGGDEAAGKAVGRDDAVDEDVDDELSAAPAADAASTRADRRKA
ncbi:hypothetical protein AB4212_64740, partial [Streptomyces sp. 2MCAF27]